MIILKSKADIEKMEVACRIAADALQLAGSMVEPGITTASIDKAVRDFIEKQGAKPSFLGYGGFPASVCISINEEVIHGIPGSRKILDGDIVSVDVGANIYGFHGDCANTYAAGKCDEESLNLIKVTKESFFEGAKLAIPGNRVSDISHGVGSHCEKYFFGVVEDFTGHGIGQKLHEDPQIPNYGNPGRGPRLMEGMTICIEPMVNAGLKDVYILEDDWTVVTKDGKCSAHFEHTILITKNGPRILTLPSGEADK